MTISGIARYAGALAIALTAAGCVGEVTPDNGGDESDSQDTSRYTESAIVGQKAKVEASTGLHLRTGPSTTYSIILTMPDGAIVPVYADSNGWYKVDYDGHTGWCSGAFLTPTGTSNGGGTSGGGTGTSPVDKAIARAQSGMGFSYHWGGGCWDPSSSNHGACYGSCPSCSHSGEWGADCSGFAAKVWQVPGASALTSCQHPYSTWNFYNTHDHWYDVSRSNVKRGDAFVYNTSGEGHIFIYDSGDAWGWAKAYECKGCSYGCVHDTRQVYSIYKPIRREGY